MSAFCGVFVFAQKTHRTVSLLKKRARLFFTQKTRQTVFFSENAPDCFLLRKRAGTFAFLNQKTRPPADIKNRKKYSNFFHSKVSC